MDDIYQGPPGPSTEPERKEEGVDGNDVSRFQYRE